LGISIRRVYLAGHSQGGPLVLRLNASHAADGVIANAPGPLDLSYRCGLEERGEVQRSVPCANLAARFGTTAEAPEAYASRSLLGATATQRSRPLVIQGLDDSPIQLHTWPTFRAQLEACVTCQTVDVLEVPAFGHPALFEAPAAREAFQKFLARP
jgi:pimeloyl-ACP methyl ester carboxylesterase